MIRVRIHVGSREPLSVDLAPGTYSLGRSDDNTIVVDVPSLSSKQIEILVTDSLQVFVKDLSGRGEMIIGGRSVVESFVKPGDIVSSGGVVVMLDLLGDEQTDQSNPLDESQLSRPGFLRELPGAFKYPLHGDTILIVVSIAVLGGFAQLFAGLFTMIGMLLGLAIGIYLVLLFREIITSTINGEDQMPAEPPISFDWEELKAVIVPMYAIVLFPMLPFILSQFWPDAPVWLRPTFGFLAFVYIPMALLLLLVTDEFWAAHPGNVFLSILRAPIDYLGVLSLLLAVVGLMFLMDFSNGPLLGKNRYLMIGMNTLLELAEIYLLFAWARALGLFYRHNRGRLQWE